MNIHDEELVDNYLSSIENLQAKNNQDIIDRLSFSYAKILPFLDENELIGNKGPVEISENSISRTSLAHKAMLDLSDGSKEIKIFAKGLHDNMYGSEFVIDSFKNFVSRFVNKHLDENGNFLEDAPTPATLILKEKNKEVIGHLRKSDFVKLALNLKKQYSKNILDILIVEDSEKEVEIHTCRLSENEKSISFNLEKEKVKPSKVCSFSIFGDFYRLRVDEERGHKAYINLSSNDQDIAKFKDNFDALKQVAKKLDSFEK